MAGIRRVRDLFDLPEEVRKGDFVLKLSEGLERPAETARQYVVTPGLVDKFHQALGLVGAALSDSRSKAAYVHGSFGSGKSHFMALLSLLLSGAEEAWRIPALHGLRQKHPFTAEEPRLAQLHFHMIGADSIESAVFLQYLRFVEARHPEATIPGLFADEKLFEDASELLETVGDETFFAKMTTGTGRLGAFSDRWDRERFEACRTSTDPREREKLFSALAKSHFKAFAAESRRFIDLDRGLAVIANHAAGLGYRAVLLYLDELILWMLGRASESAWLHKEAQKLVKLVEAQEGRREVPIVSLIARQRDLADVVGDEYAGAEAQRLRDSLQWSEERFAKILIEDRDLVAIASQRVLKPKDGAASEVLDQAFEAVRKSAGSAWQTMLAGLAPEAFRQIYPFSPALLHALVGLSNSLQRERTAIKLLMELLVEHIRDLEVGEVVRVGDLFDVLAAGDDPADGAMRARFSVGRELYQYRFLPMIQETHKTTTPERCQRLRDDHPVRIGCSNCPEKLCRADNRLAKTLLIAALVPKALPELTASKLVELNHGSIKLPIPGTEANIVAQKLRGWSTHISQLHVGGESDPSVHLELEDIDVESILAKAAGADQEGARQRVIRDLLFDEMGVGKIADWGKDHTVEWHNTRRPGHLRFGNVRKLGREQLGCPDEHDWRLVVDYPFDEGHFGPNDDLAVIEEIQQKGGGGWTLVWLPSFFSEASKKLLGKLTILEHILENKESLGRYTADLSADNQVRAEHNLENLRSNLRTRLVKVLREAYGLVRADEGDLDETRSLEKNLYLLEPGASIRAGITGTLADALENYAKAILAARYPRHPRFAVKLSRQRLARLLETFGDLIDSGAGRIEVDAEVVKEMDGSLALLGLVRTSENTVHLREDDVLQRIENKREQKGTARPTVGQVREWIDPNGRMGLSFEAVDLVVRCYARASSRTLVQYDKAVDPPLNKPIGDGVELERPDLPAFDQWARALDAAGALFGITLARKALHADNLKRFEAQVQGAVERASEACARLPARLSDRLGALDVGSSDRATTAASADALCAALSGKGGVGTVETLASFEPRTSARAVGSSIARAGEVLAVLEDELIFGVFAQLVSRGDEERLEKVRRVLREDEVVTAAAPRLRELAREAMKEIEPSPPPPPPGTKVTRHPIEARGKKAALEAIESLRAAIERLGPAVSVRGAVVIEEPEEK
jgi:hypothetical protein